MIISEKQLTKLIRIAENYAFEAHKQKNMNLYDYINTLLFNIETQQSEELREIE